MDRGHRRACLRAAQGALLGVWLMAGCLLPGARETVHLPDRHQLRGEQLVVRSDFKVAEDDALIAELNEVRIQVSETLHLPRQRRPVVVYLFRDENRYQRYMAAAHPDLPSRRAFFIGSPTELAVYAYCGDQVREDLRHEYTHGLLHASLRNVPLWLDEGLAEYFEVSAYQPGRINPEHSRWLAEAIQNGWQPDLKRLEQLEDVSEMQRADYQEAWAWVHFLLHETDDGRQLVLDYLQELRSTSRPPSLAARIAAEFPRPEQRLVSYIAGVTSGAVAAPSLPRAQSTGL